LGGVNCGNWKNLCTLSKEKKSAVGFRNNGIRVFNETVYGCFVKNPNAIRNSETSETSCYFPKFHMEGFLEAANSHMNGFPKAAANNIKNP
jgi:hypothetical protein